MIKTYRILAYTVAAEVIVQAALVAWFVFGLSRWVVADGGTFDSAAIESQQLTFPEVAGFALHAMNGVILVPVFALALLIISFFAKIPGGIKWAVAVFVLVVVQVLIGFFGHAVTAIGGLHGALALALFAVAVIAARRTPARLVPPVETRVESVV